MAANDYYQAQQMPPQSQTYQPYHSSGSTAQRPEENNYYGQQAPSQGRLHEPYNHESVHTTANTYTENIPLKDQNRIQTQQSEWPSAQQTAYPPSPESQNQNPALLPPTNNKRSRRKKKGGFFSGKVPWFVYFITLVQVTVFIVEIVKNCK